MMVCIFPDAWENEERAQFSVWCYTQWHNLRPLSRYIMLASVFAPLFLLYFPTESLHLNLILRGEHFPRTVCLKEPYFRRAFWENTEAQRERVNSGSRNQREHSRRSLVYFSINAQVSSYFGYNSILESRWLQKPLKPHSCGFQHHKSSLKGITVHKSQLTIISSRVQNFHQTVHVSLQKSGVEWKL